jgi:ABC-type hemin transport system ATPase subunit
MDGLAALEILYASSTAEALHHGPAERERRNRRNGEVMRDVVKRALLNPDHSIIFSFSIYGGVDSDIVTLGRQPRSRGRRAAKPKVARPSFS